MGHGWEWPCLEESELTRDSKLADWDDDDPQALQDTSSRWDKVVILKHMFTLKELEVRRGSPLPSPGYHYTDTTRVQEDPAAILDIKEDIRDECSKTGPVTNVVLFDKEVDGVASVRYSNAEAAEACVGVRNLPLLAQVSNVSHAICSESTPVACSRRCFPCMCAFFTEALTSLLSLADERPPLLWHESRSLHCRWQREVQEIE